MKYRSPQILFVFDNENQSLKDIARINEISPQQVFLAMKPISKPTNQSEGLPPTPPQGTGNKTLSDFSKEYSLDIQQILQGLTDNKVSII